MVFSSVLGRLAGFGVVGRSVSLAAGVGSFPIKYLKCEIEISLRNKNRTRLSEVSLSSISSVRLKLIASALRMVGSMVSLSSISSVRLK